MILSDLFFANEWFNEALISIVFAIGILFIGILFGKTVSYLMKKVIKKLDIKKEIHYNFAELIVIAIRWSIYVGFLSIALRELSLPIFTNAFTRMLITIPAFTGALILIGIGFAIAVYLRNVVENNEITELKTLSQYLYYFILYVFGVYALNLALIAIDDIIRNSVTIVLTVIVVSALTYVIIKKEIKKD